MGCASSVTASAPQIKEQIVHNEEAGNQPEHNAQSRPDSARSRPDSARSRPPDSARSRPDSARSRPDSASRSKHEMVHMRKEFDSISAPMASLTLPNLTKFHARMLREATLTHSKSADKFKKELEGIKARERNKVKRIGAKNTQKTLEQIIISEARVVSVSVFKVLGYWDELENQPIRDKTVTFEQYLQVVLKSRMKEASHPTPSSAAYVPRKREGSILKQYEPLGKDWAESVGRYVQRQKMQHDDEGSVFKQLREMEKSVESATLSQPPTLPSALPSDASATASAQPPDAPAAQGLMCTDATQLQAGEAAADAQLPDERERAGEGENGRERTQRACSSGAAAVAEEAAAVELQEEEGDTRKHPAAAAAGAAAVAEEAVAVELQEEERRVSGSYSPPDPLSLLGEGGEVVEEKVVEEKKVVDRERLNGLVLERLYILTDEEAHYKLCAILDIKENSRKFKENAKSVVVKEQAKTLKEHSKKISTLAAVSSLLKNPSPTMPFPFLSAKK